GIDGGLVPVAAAGVVGREPTDADDDGDAVVATRSSRLALGFDGERGGCDQRVQVRTVGRHQLTMPGGTGPTDGQGPASVPSDDQVLADAEEAAGARDPEVSGDRRRG